MRCPKCETENPEPATVCVNCSAALVLVCPRCGTALPPQARYCFHCATPVATIPAADGKEFIAPSAGSQGSAAVERAIQRFVPKDLAKRLLSTRGPLTRERRTMTILFSDVEGSTAMAEALDPEDVMEIMDGAFDLLIEPVYRYEGTLARLMGDGILAFFGAPIAYEDDPERACRAALEITAEAQRYAEKLERERGIQGFAVRVGINTGLVVVGEVGSDLRVEYTAMGDAVNLAARLESAAEPGTVLVSEATHKLIAPLFETEALGALEVKGRVEPVAVYRVLSARAEAGKQRGIAGLESSLVGREAEFQALGEAQERLTNGTGGIVTVVGEAGIGKSRLVAELRRGAVTAPHQWLEGRCLSYGSSMAYLLWLDVLRNLLGVRAEDAPEDRLATLSVNIQALCPDEYDEVYPYLGRLMALPLEEEVSERLEQMDGQQRKTATFGAVQSLLTCAAGQEPLVLVCEDLHWADPTSVELLERLLPLTEREPLLIVCVFRPERAHRSWRLRETATREHVERHTDLVLEPLSEVESEELVGNLLRLEGLPEQLKAQIQERAEGNPFYLEEVLRSLIDEGSIEQEAATGRWLATKDVGDIAIPDTLQGVLMARIDRLREETKRVLQTASVIGRLFLYRVLAAIAAEERDLDGRLLTLRQEEMIRERARLPELEYIFRHHLTQEAAYNGLLRKERRVFHRQVAEALERLFPERVEEQVGLLAHHWERAGDGEKAAKYLLQAGDQARLAYAQEEAVDYYRRALFFLEAAESYDLAARTQMKLGLTYDSAFDFQRSRQAYQDGFALWQRAGDSRADTALPPAPHALRLARLEPSTLDPTFVRSVNEAIIAGQLFAGLAAQTPDLGIVPDVAKRWEVSGGGRRYTFFLREGVLWSDGAPLTAHDFEYAWKRALDPATASPNAPALYDVKGAKAYHQGLIEDPDAVGVQARGDAVLDVELEQPSAYFLHLLACLDTFPVPRHVVEQRGAAWAHWPGLVTNGPFCLASWERGESMLLVRYPHYHGRFRGNVHQVTLTILPGLDTSRDFQMYEAGLLDHATVGSPALQEKEILHKLAGESFALPAAETSYLAFPLRRAPFDDPRLRRAFAQATNREAFPDVTLQAYASPALGGLVPPGIPGHLPDIALPYDPERARQLLAEAGYPGGEGFPQVDWLTLPGYRARAGSLQAQWRETLGLDTRWRVIEWADLSAMLDPEPLVPFLLLWLPDWPDPDNYLRVFISRRTPSWNHGTYSALVDEAGRTLDQEKRMGLYAQAERILAEQVPVLPLTYHGWHMLLKPWVKKFPATATGQQFWKDVIIEPH